MYIKIRLKVDKLIKSLIKEYELDEEKVNNSELEYQIIDNFLSREFIKSVKEMKEEVYLEDKLIGYLSTVRYSSWEDLFNFSVQITEEDLFYEFLGLIKGDKKKTIFDLVGTHTLKVDWDVKEEEDKYLIANPRFSYKRKKKGT